MKIKNPYKKEALAGYLFAAPAIIGFLLLTLYPMIVSLVYSFMKIDAKGGKRFIGFANYEYMFLNSGSEFMKSLQVTLLYTLLNVILLTLFCLIIALLLNRKFIGRNLLRAIFYLPSVVPMLTTAILWKLIMQNQAQGGLINQLLLYMGMNPQEWLMDKKLIFVVLLAMSLWTSGGNTVVFLATLQDVPRELLEAARVDGANAFWQFRAVTFQTIKPVLFFQMIMCMVTSIQIFTQSVALSSNGGPDRMTYFINVMIYQHSFKDLGLRGLASAEAWIVFLVTMVIALVMFTIGGTFKKDDGTTRKGRKKH
ncbi:carbohydrate ABC transporter permease [Diplocloster agilis]|uniref:Sugar ABC transporter permease n=1 Tax=Diplocloster agilis TaxID=2850323 RepID=A0A949NGG4_9FIRM|nr:MULTISPECIES: sugar ABC transporter permease [Lachnospiraceae]MBU9739621.1 sugar ABC transporter permease [Diplocloster agilis]MCU6736961.1 sugar ABC transporter permease [Suonthocola fibrivorans]SCJ94771.1 Inner membrane ABC transporter permease protein ycjO [uncultured Clostridium sp.]